MCLGMWGFVSSNATGEVWQAKRVLVITSEAELEQMSSLVSVLSVHFQDLDTEVVLEVVDYPPRDVFEQVSAIKALVQSRGAFSALWVERNKEELFLFVADKTTQKVFLQTFQGSDEGWEAECDTIAALARSALVGWLSVESEQTVEKGSVSKAPSKALEKERAVVTAPAVVVEKEIEKKKEDAKPLSFLVATGYNPKLIHHSEPVSHNIHFGIGAVLKERAVVGVAANSGPALKLKVREYNIHFWHMSVYIKSGPVLLITPRVELGLLCAFVLDISRLVQDAPNFHDKVNLVHPGLGFYGKARIQLLPHFSAFLEFGTDFFIKHYSWGEEEVMFRYNVLQPSLVLGFELNAWRKKKKKNVVRFRSATSSKTM